MQSIRTLIRQAIIQSLQASKLLKANVQAESHSPIALQELPLVTVSLNKANSIPDWTAADGQGGLLEMIEQSIVIKITAYGSQALEAKLEQFAASVGQVLAQDETLGGLVKALRIEEEAEINISAEAEQPIGVLTMRFIVLYRRPSLQLNVTCN